jgi:hypothetical protein
VIWASGIPKASWLFRDDFAGVPVMISRGAFATKASVAKPLRPFRRPRRPLATFDGLDVGAFALVSAYGDYPFDDATWAHDAGLLVEQIGRPRFVSPRDKMCEPWMLTKMGATVRENQDHTTRSVLELRRLRPDLPWLPVLQGWAPEDYERHADDYQRHGIDLVREPLVGIGSVCKRKGRELEAAPEVFWRLQRRGIRCHAFGLAVRGLEELALAGLVSADEQTPGVVSADSQAGLLMARRKGLLLPGHGEPDASVGRERGHKNCATCPIFALGWRATVLQRIREALSSRRPRAYIRRLEQLSLEVA